MAALFRLLRILSGLALIAGGLFVFSRLGLRAPLLRSRPFVLLVVLPLILIVVWAVRKATDGRDK